MTRLRAAAGATLALAAAVTACQLVAGIERVPKETATPSNEAGPDVDAGPTAVDPCEHVDAPREPETDDDPRAEVPPFYVAVSRMSFVDPTPSGLAGFDLDGVCTCDTRPGTARQGQPSCAGRAQNCDDDGGLDNGSARIFQQFAGITNIDDAANVNKNIDDGVQTVLLWIGSYNGQPNDKEVAVGLLPSTGIYDGSGCNTAEGSTTGHFKPGWCGKDKWSVPPGFLLPPNYTVPIGRAKGWVNNGQLVFRAELAVEFYLGQTRIRYGSPVSVGRLFKGPTAGGGGGTAWQIENGVLAGRMPVQDLLTAFGTFRTPGGGVDGSTPHLCSSPLFGSVKKIFCDSPDIASTLAFDFTSGACDAVSTAVTFTASEAALGGQVEFDAGGNECFPGASPGASYTCD